MFYLGGNGYPATREQLVSAISDGLKRVMQFPSGGPKVDADGSFPALATLEIDLSNGQIDPASPPPKPEGTGQTQPGITVASLKVLAHPLRVASARLTLDMTARDARLDFDRNASGVPLLVASHVAEGKLDVSIPHADLEALVYSQAKALASQQGANLTSLALTLSSRGPRSVAFEAKAGVKKFFVSGVLRITGQVDVNDQLVARVWGLDVKGEGLAMSLAEGLIRNKLKQAEGREIALASFSAAGLRLRDVRLDAADPVAVTAWFGE